MLSRLQCVPRTLYGPPGYFKDFRLRVVRVKGHLGDTLQLPQERFRFTLRKLLADAVHPSLLFLKCVVDLEY